MDKGKDRKPSRRTLWLLIGAAALGVIAGYYLGHASPETSGTDDQSAAAHTQGVAFWTCSMHPQIREPEPGSCRICGMELIPVLSEAAHADAPPRQFTTSETARQLMNIEVAEVERRFVTKEVRLVGKVDFDETRLAAITAWVPGRIDRMYVDYTGIEVNKGDHMVYLYSPDLLVAQQELRRAAQSLANLPANAPESLKRAAQTTLTAAQEKLRRWGLADSQIDRAKEKGITSDHVTIYAPISGTVIDRIGEEGMYVQEGTRIYTLAGLSTVWVKLDAYESDLPWLHYGQTAHFTTQAYPGEDFEGRISFIDPVLDPMTRTVNVRVVLDNPDGKLKPEMFVRAVVRAEVATGGRVMDPALAGKWISPMHPEIVKDGPGTCDVCGMPLVKAEELGYVSAQPGPGDKPLVIPASAPLITGTRAVVYVEQPDAERPNYVGREIVLGPRAGDYYIVKSGLEEGERVVVQGNFKIDSALQIQAKPSMMAPEPEESAPMEAGDKNDGVVSSEAPAAFRQQLRQLYESYADLTGALASDDYDSAVTAATHVQEALSAVDMELLKGEGHMRWMDLAKAMRDSLDAMTGAADIKGIREGLPELTGALQQAITAFGIASGDPVYQAHCPMAVDGEGGDWLQPGTDVLNPYYGEMMLRCGEIVKRLDQPEEAAASVEPAMEGSAHEGSAHE